MGRSGRAMIQAAIEGKTDPAKLAAMAHWKVRASEAALWKALGARIKRHRRFLLQLIQHLQQIDALDAVIAEIDREADALDKRHLMPHHERCKQRVHLIGDGLTLVLRHARKRYGRDAAVAAMRADFDLAVDASVPKRRKQAGKDPFCGIPAQLRLEHFAHT